MELKWYKLIDAKFNLDKVLIWARKLQLSSSGHAMSTDSSLNGDLGSDQRYWTGEFPQKEFDYINSLIPLDGKFKGIKTSCSLWEYQTHTHLKPHIHENETDIEGLLIVPLIGRFKTSIFKDDVEIDSVEYSPKTIFFLKGKEFVHGGEAIDGYRLCVNLYIKQGTDLDSYIQ
tara:strand:- start:2539 stop:3057 length:519 start_codon:yes stop_codon:yes gene_type:complete